MNNLIDILGKIQMAAAYERGFMRCVNEVRAQIELIRSEQDTLNTLNGHLALSILDKKITNLIHDNLDFGYQDF